MGQTDWASAEPPCYGGRVKRRDGAMADRAMMGARHGHGGARQDTGERPCHDEGNWRRFRADGDAVPEGRARRAWVRPPSAHDDLRALRIAEYNQLFVGWDFSYFNGRRV